MPKRVSINACALALATLAAFPAHAADTLFEFFNSNLVHYFLTIDPAEAAAIESGAAGPGWSRTGKTIAAYKSAAGAPAGVVVVCRFYGNQAKGGPNSHFYTSESAECEAVKKDEGWTFERNEFFVIPSANGACPNGGVPVYRVYNGRFLEKDSNHRYMTELAVYNQMVAQGWKAEGVVFCGAPAETPPNGGSGQCGNTFIEAGRTINYSQTDAPAMQRKLETATTTFNGQTARQVTDRNLANGAHMQTTFLVESASAFTVIGYRTINGSTNQDTFLAPGFPVAKQWVLNQAVAYDLKILPQEPFAEEARQVGTVTYLGIESVTVPAGTYSACKLRVRSTTTGTQTGGVITGTSDVWVFPAAGMVKEINTTALVISGTTLPETTVIIEATSVQ